MAFRLYPFLTGSEVVRQEPYVTLDIDLSYNRKVTVFIDRDKVSPENILKNIRGTWKRCWRKKLH